MRDSILTWAQIAAHLIANPAQSCVKLEKWRVEHPQVAGLRRSLGLPLGQMGDWRMPYPNCGGLHVREFADYYTAHVDRVNPNCDLPGHMSSDAPAVGGGAALGALVGLILGESAGAMMVGALIGGALGAAATGTQEKAACDARPRKV